ncbi:MAG: sulfotransferase [Phycisphaerales bacterium]|nr:sulfotransferase [Phycisphaerales bacterium]
MQTGRFEDARQLLADHTARRRNDHEAIAMLGQIAMIERDLPLAESMAMRALRGDRRRADYHAMLAEILTTAGRHKEAIARFEQAIKCHAGYEAAYAGKAETWLRMGRTEKALETARSCPDSPLTAVPHARALIRLKQYDDAIAIAQQHANTTSIPLDVQRGLWFALATACERAERFEDAFEAATQGNALSAGGWSDEAAQTRNETLMRIFSSDQVARLPRVNSDDERLIFIVGIPRCGSTLTEQIIDAHSQAIGLGEIETLGRLVLDMPEHLGARLPWPDLLNEVNEPSMASLAKTYLADIDAAAGSATRVIDKQLGNIIHIGLINLLFPKARIIHCTRDPMDMGLSCWMQKFAPGTNTWANNLTSLGQMIRRTDALMTHWKQTLNLNLLEVPYEALVGDLDLWARRILDFCELPFEDDCLRFWESGRTVLTLSNDQVRQPIYGSAVGRHKAWGALLNPLRASLGQTRPD